MIRLDGKKALITGGSRGIGRATAILFAQAGADVAVNYSRREKAAEEVKEKIGRLGKECVLCKADVSRKKEVEKIVKDLREGWGRIDILVNNAGVWTYGEIGNMDESIWAETMEINLDAVFYACNAAVPLMKSSPSSPADPPQPWRPPSLKLRRVLRGRWRISLSAGLGG